MFPESNARLSRSRTVALALVAALVGGAWPGAPVAVPGLAADASADIPGIPLPGTVATGRLGGAIYDVVYNLDVPPGHVLVASLSGAAGTDFDMYLFDSTATTVLSPNGLLTKSTGSTSTESIAWPTQAGGRYYIDLNGATDVEGDFRLTVQVVPDQTEPSVTMRLAGGRAATNATTVPVALTATDDLSGVIAMAFSTDGITFGDWLPFQSSSTWSFPEGDGLRALWVKVQNGVGLSSPVAAASIVIDSVPPAVVKVVPSQGSTVIGLRPAFEVTFNEPIEPASWTDLGFVVQSAGGSLVAGEYAYDAATRTGRFVPTHSLVAGATYVATVGNVTDVAGNRVTTLGSWPVTPIAPATILLRATPGVIERGGSSTLSAAITGAALPANVEVLSAGADGTFTRLTSLPMETGSASLAVTPLLNTTYRFQYGGTAAVAPAEADIRVLVRRTIVLAGRSPTVTSPGRVGRPVALTAAVGPAAAGVPVSFRLYRFDSTKRRWIYAGSRGRSTDAAGRATYVWTPTASGSWYWRASVLSTTELANNVSPVYRWSVRN
jgi:hypothetical protein